jgi:hypothetical protein
MLKQNKPASLNAASSVQSSLKNRPSF